MQKSSRTHVLTSRCAGTSSGPMRPLSKQRNPRGTYDVCGPRPASFEPSLQHLSPSFHLHRTNLVQMQL